MIMYLIMFITALVLRFKNPAKEAAFKIPGGNFGLIFVCLIGIISTITTIVISFLPPTDVNVQSVTNYVLSLMGGSLLMCLPPLILKDY